jgi:hypothetical protein
VADRAGVDTLLSWAWSINVLHVLLVDPDRDQIQLLRWDSPGMSRRFRVPRTIVQLRALYEEVEQSPGPKVPDVFAILWKLHKALSAELASFDQGPHKTPFQGPAPNQQAVNDASTLLISALLLVAEKLRADSAAAPDWRKWRIMGEALAHLPADARTVCDPGEKLQQFPLGGLLASLLEPDPGTGCLCFPALFLRHAAPAFYQLLQLHLEQASYDAVRRSGIGKRHSDAPEHSGVIHDTRVTAGPIARCLVQQALDFCSDLYGRQELRLLDPVCGNGTLLVEALRELDRREFRGRVLLTGIDILPFSQAIARFCLWHASRERTKRGLDTQVAVRLHDSLRVPWDQPDIVLMNPPFGKLDLREEGGARPDSLTWDPRFRRADTAALFVQRGLEALAPGGVLATMIPAGLLTNESSLG